MSDGISSAKSEELEFFVLRDTFAFAEGTYTACRGRTLSPGHRELALLSVDWLNLRQHCLSRCRNERCHRHKVLTGLDFRGRIIADGYPKGEVFWGLLRRYFNIGFSSVVG